MTASSHNARIWLEDPEGLRLAVEAGAPRFRGGGTEAGLFIKPSEEHFVHELAHVVTMGLPLSAYASPWDVEESISLALKRRSLGINPVENEMRTLAAELRVLEAFDAIADHRKFLEQIQRQLDISGLVGRVERRLYGRRYRLAIQDGYAVVDAIHRYTLTGRYAP